MTDPITCDCSDEFGPCEDHGTVLAQRDGAAIRTADELTMVLLDDLQACGAELSPWGRDEYARLTRALESSRDETSGSAWFANPDDAQAASELADQLESYVADLWVIREDGYLIVRPHDDCPLLDR